MKQYTVENAYTDNEKVSLYNDGKLEYYEIMSYWEVEGYCSALNSQGYTKAYDVSRYEKKMLEAKEEYERTASLYERAKKHPLKKAN